MSSIILSYDKVPVRAYFADKFVFKSLFKAASENLLCRDDRLISCRTDSPLKEIKTMLRNICVQYIKHMYYIQSKIMNSSNLVA